MTHSPEPPHGPEPLHNPEPLLPLGLRLRGRRVVVVGGGPVALRRVGVLMAAHAEVTVVAPTALAALEDLAERGQIHWLQRPYEPGDLGEAWLAMACTADPEVTAQVVAEADQARILALVADPGLRLRNQQAASSGRVILVGGGPGDPELLTLKGFQALADAEVVVVDRLAPLAVLDGLREGVEIIDVSKIPRGRFTPQEEINEILVSRARKGRVVVRLKGGDPFVFGRGMEEVIACQEAGVPVEVIPGVTSAIAAPEVAGIPLTHRGFAQGFTVVSGHVAPGDPRSTLDWDALARGGTTLVVLMGVENLASIVEALVAAGLEMDTPVACVMDAGLPSQRAVVTSLSKVAGSGPPLGLHSPAVIVIGAVAAFAAE